MATNNAVVTSQIKEVQATLLEMLHAFDELCKREGLLYHLGGGTFLGAVRHKGFIPWDDDVDLCMFRDEYDKLLHLPPSKFPEGYYLHSYLTDDNYAYPFAKFRKEGTEYIEENTKHLDVDHTVWIDIFPIDYCRSPRNPTALLRAKWVHALMEAQRRAAMRKNGAEVPVDSFKAWFFDMIGRGDSHKLAMMKEKAATAVGPAKEKGESWLISYDDLTNDICQMHTVYPYAEVQFEDMTANVVRSYDHWLTQLYGADYMEIPPEWKRYNHAPKSE